jgi:hypothetical protein
MQEAVDARSEVLLAHFSALVQRDVAVPVAAMDALTGVIKGSDNVSEKLYIYLYIYISIYIYIHPYIFYSLSRACHMCAALSYFIL